MPCCRLKLYRCCFFFLLFNLACIFVAAEDAVFRIARSLNFFVFNDKEKASDMQCWFIVTKPNTGGMLQMTMLILRLKKNSKFFRQKTKKRNLKYQVYMNKYNRG